MPVPRPGKYKSEKYDVIALCREHPELVEAAKPLELFTPPSAEKWWSVAKDIFWSVTASNLEAFPELQRPARTQKVRNLEKPKRTPGHEVLKNIKPAFLRLAVSDSDFPI